jgi:hypothetical protein
LFVTTYLDMSVAQPDPDEVGGPRQRWSRRRRASWAFAVVVLVTAVALYFLIAGAPFADAAGGCGGG